MTKDVFEARIALLDEMLEVARDELIGQGFEVFRGFSAAMRAYKEWKAIENGEIARPEPIVMPQDESGIGP